MAPDISRLGNDGPDFGPTDSEIGNVETSSPYKIPDTTFRDPKNRRLKVLTIGAGVSGIMMAYQIQKQCQK